MPWWIQQTNLIRSSACLRRRKALDRKGRVRIKRLDVTEPAPPTGVGHHRQTAITPKLSLRSESMRSPCSGDDLRCPDRTHLGNCSQQLDRWVALAFGENGDLSLLP